MVPRIGDAAEDSATRMYQPPPHIEATLRSATGAYARVATWEDGPSVSSAISAGRRSERALRLIVHSIAFWRALAGTPSERSPVDRRRPTRHAPDARHRRGLRAREHRRARRSRSLALFLFGWLADEMLEGSTMAFDLRVRAAAHALASPGLTHTLRLVSRLGGPSVLAVLGVILMAVFVGHRWWRGAIILFVAMAGASVLDTTLKLAFQRARPAPYFGYPLPESYSFPEWPRALRLLLLHGRRGAPGAPAAAPGAAVAGLGRRGLAHPGDRILPHLPGRALPERRAGGLRGGIDLVERAHRRGPRGACSRPAAGRGLALPSPLSAAAASPLSAR